MNINTLVSRRPEQLFQPWLYESAPGGRTHKERSLRAVIIAEEDAVRTGLQRPVKERSVIFHNAVRQNANLPLIRFHVTEHVFVPVKGEEPLKKIAAACHGVKSGSLFCPDG